MSHFPVSSSNLSAAHLGSYLKDQYNIEGNVHCSLLRAGVNHTYLLGCGDERFVFRVYSLNWRTRPEIEEEIKLVRYLKEKAIPVSYAIPDRNGNHIQVLNAPEGERLGVLFSIAEGDKLHNYPEELHSAVGAIMANMHLVTENLEIERTDYTWDVFLVDPFKHIRKFISADSEEMQFLERTAKWLSKQLSDADASKLRKGVVHLDIWFDNLNITESGKITLFDFDFCGNGFLCLDVAYYVLQLYHVERDEETRDKKLAAFFKGYEFIVPLSPEEKRILPMLGVALYIFYLGVQSNRYENWSNSFLSESYLKRFISQLVKRYYDLHGLGKEREMADG
ncbi:phosphotransferase [Danxiaibacter flavus]|uniref:Phosphotransferase n=1 Tax=Danxiaibacter flavus TaxID=3049108 RepID=A0ABV3ZDN2_9BACT|nr:phosphotransferase [Chitinophagaceae bacterium DXS]